jgi:putative pre-16S rRNA nuclease
MAVAAIDFGTRKIGIAVTDAAGLLAHPLAILERRSIAADIDNISRILKSRAIDRVVVGLPLNMDATEGPMARAARAFAERLRHTTGLAVELHDERLTSFEARDRVAQLKRRARKNKKRMIDAIAAAVILESWLERNRPRESRG